MNRARFDTNAIIGAATVAAAILGAVTGRRSLSWSAAFGAFVVTVFAMRTRADTDRLRDEARDANAEIEQLEETVAAQVQNRLAAEAAVKNLGDQLRTAEQRLGDATGPVMFDGGGGEPLTDPTTGLFNQEYFLLALDSRVAAARRHLRPVAVAILEVVAGPDGEDRPAADPLVVADALRETLRESDTATRLGGGRFGVVLEDTPEDGAVWTIERIRRCLATDRNDTTLWAGIACYPAHAFEVGALVERAETALAAARDWHQDRIEIATAD